MNSEMLKRELRVECERLTFENGLLKNRVNVLKGDIGDLKSIVNELKEYKQVLTDDYYEEYCQREHWEGEAKRLVARLKLLNDVLNLE